VVLGSLADNPALRALADSCSAWSPPKSFCGASFLDGYPLLTRVAGACRSFVPRTKCLRLALSIFFFLCVTFLQSPPAISAGRYPNISFSNVLSFSCNVYLLTPVVAGHNIASFSGVVRTRSGIGALLPLLTTAQRGVYFVCLSFFSLLDARCVVWRYLGCSPSTVVVCFD
jgi:hypothetical protein